ncbi:DUF2357 domain-containing protein [Treponema bryantii]|uniref:DUF2357 domain-containing protein n=1 Tax=Treponema bryantii TaxID=163 RepID=UPI0003B4DDCF|nr:DUF2357 domain-containing protein [Treponema bryantii]
MNNIVAISKILDDSHIVWLYPFEHAKFDKTNKEQINESTFYYSNSELKKQYFEYKELANDTFYNINSLRLKETVRYTCRIENTKGEKIKEEVIKKYFPKINNQDNNNKLVKVVNDNDRITFQFINYLGKTFIYFGDNKSQRIDFEIVPDKIDYEADYIQLTEDIAKKCAALLLDYSSSTNLTFVHDSSRESKLLEQFIFLRTFCYSENIETLFASIKRNPDRILIKEDELKPIGQGIPSSKYFTNPFSNSCGWTKTKSGEYFPLEIAVTHKYDSYDTVANRFIKFALITFSEICENVYKKINAEKGGKVYSQLAQEMYNKIYEILNDSFFDDVGELEVMPISNQVLEKREGYSQIFNAFSMIDLALQLDWKEKEDVFLGESKNTALLYEYWLFFELRDILKELNGEKETVDNSYTEFIEDKNGLTITLIQGKTSRETFLFENGITVNLYYNRTFAATEFKNSIYWGSYSRPFRPDYTIAVFPSTFNTEDAAIIAGEVSYIHFDAKYRIEDIKQFVKPDRIIDDEKLDNIETETDEKLIEELNDEKNDEIVNTYKRGDLLKMHTYNDAIRRTIGSYVLYPGTSDNKNENNKSKIYDEILPGVGAFAIRPGDSEKGHEAIKDFINGIIEFKADTSRKISQMDTYENMLLKGVDIEINDKNQPSVIDNGETLFGYIDKNYLEHLIVLNWLPIERNNKPNKSFSKNFEENRFFLYYYPVIKGGKVVTLQKDFSKVKYFRGWTDSFPKGLNFKVKVDTLNPELLSQAELRNRLINSENMPDLTNGDFFYVLKLFINDIIE